MITCEMLEKRIELLMTERDHLQAQVHAFTGAIQDCEYWLKQLEEEKKDEV